MSSMRSAIILFASVCMCVLALTNGFAPVARRALPVMVHNFKQVRSSSQGSHSNNFRLFADNDGKKITRDKEGEFFESEFDKQPLSDRLPIALGFLGFVSLPFIVGLIYLYTNK